MTRRPSNMAIDIGKDLTQVSDDELRQLLDQIQGMLLTGELGEGEFGTLRESIHEEMLKRGMGDQESPSLLDYSVRKKTAMAKLNREILTIQSAAVHMTENEEGRVNSIRFDEFAVTKAFRRGAMYMASILDSKDAIRFSSEKAEKAEPLFDLALIPHNREVMFKVEEVEGSWDDLAYFYSLRHGTKQVRGSARASWRKDEVLPGRFVALPVSKRVSHPEYAQDVKELQAHFSEGTYPLYAIMRHSPVDVQIHLRGKKIFVWTENGKDITAKVPKIVEDVKMLFDGSQGVVLLANLQALTKGEKVLSPLGLAEYLDGKTELKDGFIRARVYDCLHYHDEDFYCLPYDERYAKTKALLTDGLYALQMAETKVVANGKCIVPSINGMRKAPDCFGVKFLKADPCVPSGPNPVLYEHTLSFRAQVIDVKATTIPGVSNFSIGVQAPKNMNFSPEDLVLNNERKIVRLGDTLSTSRWSYPGDIVEVATEAVVHRYDEGEDQHTVRILRPRVVNKVTTVGYPNDAIGVLKNARKAGIYHATVLDKEGNAEYFVSIEDQMFNDLVTPKAQVDVKSEEDDANNQRCDEKSS
jgi:hypothetical protein